MPSNFTGLTQSGYSQMTPYGAFQNVGDSIEKMPTGGSDFVQGMKWGYAGSQASVGVFTAWHEARYQRSILYMQAQLQDMQTKQLDTAADDAMRAGYQQAASISFQAGQAKGSQRASMGGSGLQVGVGSSARVLTSIDIAKEMNVNQALANAVTASFGYRRAATNSRAEAMAIRQSASNIKPWAAALSQLVSASMNAMSMSGFGGGSSAGSSMGGSIDLSNLSSAASDNGQAFSIAGNFSW